VPRSDNGTREVYTTYEGDTLSIDLGSFMVTGGRGCYVLGR
jgi:DNA-binding beta-propeller fold protein YncE